MIKNKNDLTQDELKTFVHYDPITGIFTWLSRPGRKMFNKRYAGKTASTITGSKNKVISIKIGVYFYLAHRLAWLYMTGSFPKELLDHINRNPLDNRIVNLREATNSQNGMNSTIPKDNKSGYKGVGYGRIKKKWTAEIMAYKKRYHLGTFNTKEEAIAARLEAEERLFGEFSSLYGTLIPRKDDGLQT